MSVIRFQTHEQWLARRPNGLGASDAAPALGIEGAFRTQWQLYQEKRNGVQFEADPRTAELMYWGQVHEPGIRQRVKETFGCDVYWRKHEVRLHSRLSWMYATPDGILTANDQLREAAESQEIDTSRMYDKSPGILECKCVSWWAARAWEDVRVPPHYEAQIRHLMAVLGCDWALMAALVAGDESRYTFLARDEELERLLIDGELAFWQDVQEGNEPPPDGTPATSRFLRKLYPRATEGLRVQLPGEAIEWDANRCEAHEALRHFEEEKRKCDHWLEHAIGDAEYGDLPNGVSYSWRNQTRRVVCKNCGNVVQESESRYIRRHEPKTPKTRKGDTA